MGAVWSAERVTAGPHELRETQRQELAEISVGDVSIHQHHLLRGIVMQGKMWKMMKSLSHRRSSMDFKVNQEM